MTKNYSTYSFIHAELITGKDLCFFLVFNSQRPFPTIDLCPFERPLMTSLYTKLIPLDYINNFNPKAFIEGLSITREDSRPKILAIPSYVRITLPENGWVLVPSEPDLDIYSISEDKVMKEFSTKETPNVIVQYSQTKSNYERANHHHNSDEELEKYKDRMVYTEAMFDDYHYRLDSDGNLACDGISMKDDMDGCEAYQERHPDRCSKCMSRLRV